MAHIHDGGDKFLVEATYRESEMMKTVPGATWRNAEGVWYLPRTWASLAAMRGTFGEDMKMEEEVVQWAWSERNNRITPALEARKPSASSSQAFGFQEDGVKFLRAAGSALLGDEMGLGKSRQAILAMDLPALVVCPNSMKFVWKAEVEKWRPELTVAVVEGTAASKKKALSSGADIVIVNWESLRSLSRLAPYGSKRLSEKEKTPGPLNQEWATVIADEAHRAKDPNSQQTRALWAVGGTSARRIALTGTPVANSPADLWSIMHFVSPEEWPSRSKFIDRYCNSSLNFWGGLDVYSLKSSTRTEMDSFFEPRFLRRTKAEVLPQLPPKTYAIRSVSLTSQQAKVYEALRKEMVAKIEDGWLTSYDPMVNAIRLLQTASAMPVLDENGGVESLSSPSNKLSALIEIIDERAGEPLIVFAASRKLIELCARELGELRPVLITGAQSPAERSRSVEEFQGGASNLALLTLGAGGEGITLTRSDTAVFLQRSWSLVQNLQAEDRIHRIGQSGHTVSIIDVVSRGTIEERVREVMKDKGMTLAQAVKDPHLMKTLLDV